MKHLVLTLVLTLGLVSVSHAGTILLRIDNKVTIIPFSSEGRIVYCMGRLIYEETEIGTGILVDVAGPPPDDPASDAPYVHQKMIALDVGDFKALVITPIYAAGTPSFTMIDEFTGQRIVDGTLSVTFDSGFGGLIPGLSFRLTWSD